MYERNSSSSGVLVELLSIYSGKRARCLTSRYSSSVCGFFCLPLLLPILWQLWKPITIIIATLSAVNVKCYWSCDSVVRNSFLIYRFFLSVLDLFCSVRFRDVRCDNNAQTFMDLFRTGKKSSVELELAKIVLKRPKIALAPLWFLFLFFSLPSALWVSQFDTCNCIWLRI